jgi:hypothetical protein
MKKKGLRGNGRSVWTGHCIYMYTVQYLIPAVQAGLTLTAGVGGERGRVVGLLLQYSSLAAPSIMETCPN